MNKETNRSRTPKQQYGKPSDTIITFEHTKVRGINFHDEFLKLQNIIHILENMEVGVYSMVEI